MAPRPPLTYTQLVALYHLYTWQLPFLQPPPQSPRDTSLHVVYVYMWRSNKTSPTQPIQNCIPEHAPRSPLVLLPSSPLEMATCSTLAPSHLPLFTSPNTTSGPLPFQFPCWNTLPSVATELPPSPPLNITWSGGLRDPP